MKLFSGSWSPLVTGVSCALLITSCATVPKGAPKELSDANDTLSVADKQDVEKTLPVTMKKAHEDFAASVKQFKESESIRQDDSKKADVDVQGSIEKANASKTLAEGAMTLNDNLKQWDQSTLTTLAGNYSIPELVAQIRTMKSQMAQSGTDRKGVFAKLKDVRFQGSVAFFDTDKAKLDKVFTPVVGEVASLLKADDMLVVTVSGFADPRGEKVYNDKLAAKRANAVASILEERGIPKDRITVTSMGNRHAHFKSNLIKMQLERRVDVTVALSSTEEAR